MRGRRCTICENPRREELDADLQAGATLDAVVENYDVSRSGVYRHRINCLGMPVSVSPEKREAREALKRAEAEAKSKMPPETREAREARLRDAAEAREARKHAMAEARKALKRPVLCGQVCSVCAHDAAQEIDESLVTGAKMAPLAKKHGLTTSALHRHFHNCLPIKTQTAARIAQDRQGKPGHAPVRRAKLVAAGVVEPTAKERLSLESLLGRLIGSLERLDSSARTAAEENLHNSLAAVSSQYHRAIELSGKMTGVFNEAAQVAAGSQFSVNIILPSQVAGAQAGDVVTITANQEAPLRQITSDAWECEEEDACLVED